MIYRYSIHPFDICSNNIESIVKEIEKFGFIKEQVPENEEKIIGFNIHYFSSRDTNISLRITEQGFGVFITKKEYPFATLENHQDVANIIIDRKKYHINAIKRNSTVFKLFSNIFKKVQKGSRPDIFKGFPYILSYFVVSEENFVFDKISTKQFQSLFALFEPSRIASSESDEMSENKESIITEKISCLDIDECKKNLQDYDIKKDSQLFASWAGVVKIINPLSLDQDSSLLNAMETRIQLGWIISHYIQKWSQQIIKNNPSLSNIEDAKWKIMPLLRGVESVTDASISTRNSNFLDILKQTSGLKDQISSAAYAFQDIENYAEYNRIKKSRKYEVFTEVALFILATTQIIPLFWELPILTLDMRWLSLVGLVIVLFIFLIIKRR